MEERKVNLNLEIAPEFKMGAFADAAIVWHTEHEFTIDFICPVMPGQEGADGIVQQAAAVVSRVRLPVGVIFQVARAISENVSQYEKNFGTIGAGGPDHPPEEAA